MEAMIDKVRLSYKEKNAIAKMKGKTGLDNWNIFSHLL